MMQNALNRMLNGEGYKDPTPFFALQGDMKMSNWRDGDIFKIARPDGNDLVRLILKMHSGYALTVNLYPREQRENDYKVVVGQDVMHCDIGRLSYTPAKDLEFADHFNTVEESELDDLKYSVGVVMGCSNVRFEDLELWKQKVQDVESDKEDLFRKVAILEEKMKEKEEYILELKSRISMAQKEGSEVVAAERDVYKSILEQVISRIGIPDYNGRYFMTTGPLSAETGGGSGELPLEINC